MSNVRSVQSERAVALPSTGETYVADDGTVSQVLDDTVDEHYEPTEEEVHDYAKWMGLQLPEDKDLLWIAKEGLKTPLPKEWKPCRTDDGEVYYFNFRTGESSWYHPMDAAIRKKFEQEKARRQQQRQQQSPTRAGATNAAPVPGTSSPASPVALTSAGGGGGRRMVSESERRLETQIRDEARAVYEEEKTKAETLFAARMAAVRKLHERDMAEAKDADERRRAENKSGADAELQRKTAAARERCEAKYGQQLRELERQADELRAQHQKLVAERGRLSSQTGGTRATIEKEAAAARASALKAVEADVAAEQQAALETLRAPYRTQAAALEQSIAEAARLARVETEKAFRAKEVSAAMSIESRRKKLEEERRGLELDVRNASTSKPSTPSVSTPATASLPASPVVEDAASLEKKLADAQTQRAARCAAVQAQSRKDQDSFRRESALALAALRKAVTEAERTKTTAAEPSPTSGARQPRLQPTFPSSFSKSQPLSPSSTSSRGAGAAAGPADAFAQQLTALRSRYSKEKLETLARLGKEREARLDDARSSAASTPLANRQASTDVGEEGPPLSKSDSAVATERATLYRSIEDDWRQQFKQQLEQAASTARGTAESPDHASVVASVDADLAAYTRRVTARHILEKERLERRRAAMLSEHAAAEAAQEQRRAIADARRAAEEREAKEAMMEDAVAAALQKERTAMSQSAGAVRARRQANYTHEADIIRADIEEEMTAYLAAELQRVEAEAQSATAAPTNTAAPTTATDAARADRDGAALAAAEAALAAITASSAAQQSAQLQALRRCEDQLRDRRAALQEAERSAELRRASGDAPSPAATAAVTKLVPPPNSVATAAHAARMAALTAGYEDQASILRRELADKQQHCAQARAALSPPAAQAEVLLPGAEPVGSGAAGARADAGNGPGRRVGLSTADALQWWQTQCGERQRRRAALMRAREEWQCGEATALAVAAASDSVPPRGAAAAPLPSAAAVQSLNRTLDTLTSRVVELEARRERTAPHAHPSGLPSSPSQLRQTTPAAAAAASAQTRPLQPGGRHHAHRGGGSSSRDPHTDRKDDRDADSLRHKWSRSLLSYESEKSDM